MAENNAEFTGCWKIVAILKTRAGRKQLSFSAVPNSWLVEHDSAVLWPNNQQETLRRDLTSMPQTSWKKYKCILKKDNLTTFDEALLWEKEYIEAPDTDAEESLYIQPNVYFNTENVSHHDDNEYDDMFRTSNNLVCGEIDNNNLVSIVTSESDSNSLIHQIFQFQEKQVETINKIHIEYVQIRTMIDNIYDMLKNGNSDINVNNFIRPVAVENEFVPIIELPLNSLDDLKKCDQIIKNDDKYKQFLINKYNKIGGTDGSKKGDKIAPIVAAVFFTNELLTCTSWTGISRTKGLEKKVAFQLFDAIIDVFYQIIYLADSRWTRNDNTSFFRDKLLKHSKQRNIAIKNKLSKNNEERSKFHSEGNQSSMEANKSGTEKINSIDVNKSTTDENQSIEEFASKNMEDLLHTNLSQQI